MDVIRFGLGPVAHGDAHMPDAEAERMLSRAIGTAAKLVRYPSRLDPAQPPHYERVRNAIGLAPLSRR